MCSTPFGIIGILTVGVSPPASAPDSAQRLSASSEFSLERNYLSYASRSSAQRLSASSEFSPKSGNVPPEFRRCSTPFGIIGILTVILVHQQRDVPYVLNAF